ncbi:unnamed protein product [Protopolystoma xenopodis]|uniref:Uncharacterized protein n=1 Tax=Protopolystoma xenopodis TaxID=117903 RepID=A0A448XDS3_9PLAT|nr:unnamed protein product [Protopolystoma xenopodis]
MMLSTSLRTQPLFPGSLSSQLKPDLFSDPEASFLSPTTSGALIFHPSSPQVSTSNVSTTSPQLMRRPSPEEQTITLPSSSSVLSIRPASFVLGQTNLAHSLAQSELTGSSDSDLPPNTTVATAHQSQRAPASAAKFNSNSKQALERISAHFTFSCADSGTGSGQTDPSSPSRPSSMTRLSGRKAQQPTEASEAPSHSKRRIKKADDLLGLNILSATKSERPIDQTNGMLLIQHFMSRQARLLIQRDVRFL